MPTREEILSLAEVLKTMKECWILKSLILRPHASLLHNLWDDPSGVYYVCSLGSDVFSSVYKINRKLILEQPRGLLSRLRGVEAQCWENLGLDQNGSNDAMRLASWGRLLEILDVGIEQSGAFCASLPKWRSEYDPAVSNEWEKHRKSARAVFNISRNIMWQLADSLIRFLSETNVATYLDIHLQLVEFRLKDLRECFIAGCPAVGPYAVRKTGMWEKHCRDTLTHSAGMLSLSIADQKPGIVATFVPKNENRRISWFVPSSELWDSYETYLFGTWLYDSGKNFMAPYLEGEAHWEVSVEDYQEFELHASLIERVLEPLSNAAACSSLVEVVLRAARNGHHKWMPRHVEWTYIRDLDDVIARISAAARQGQVGSAEEWSVGATAVQNHEAVEESAATEQKDIWENILPEMKSPIQDYQKESKDAKSKGKRLKIKEFCRERGVDERTFRSERDRVEKRKSRPGWADQ